MAETGYNHYKDKRLDELAGQGYNVAQFVSFDTDLEQRYSRLAGLEPNSGLDTIDATIGHMLQTVAERKVNIRSFDPADPKSRPFEMGYTNVEDVMAALRRLSTDGLHTIVNESIDINDGGVSGVVLGDVVEFAPGDTPRCVEKPGTAQLSRELGIRAIKTVYGFTPKFGDNPHNRLEFSVHPLRRGYAEDHTIIWEAEHVGATPGAPEIRWPNRFSTLIGDKTYGLMVADMIGLPVPRTTVFSRDIAPFSFGQPTGSHENWLRTAPREQTPGLYTTIKGWTDPYKLMHDEDPSNTKIGAILQQAGIDAVYAGAAVTGSDGALIIEGTRGLGDTFMIGDSAVDTLPEHLVYRIHKLNDYAKSRLGDVRFEWVYDGMRVWVVQLHVGASASSGNSIYPGNAEIMHDYHTDSGIDGLRELIASTRGTGEGIRLLGNVGITSHFGDLLRKAQIPSEIVRG